MFGPLAGALECGKILIMPDHAMPNAFRKGCEVILIIYANAQTTYKELACEHTRISSCRFTPPKNIFRRSEATAGNSRLRS